VSLSRDRNDELRGNVVTTLSIFADKDMIPIFKNALLDWYSGRKAAQTLTKLGWKPLTINDKIHFLKHLLKA